MSRTLLVWCIVVAVGATITAGRVWSEDAVLAELYGRGVHAYFGKDYQQAHDLFTLAIEKGTQDPRVYYFRGLTYAVTGRPEEAEADFRKGAELEAADVDNYYNVSRALQRVQGAIRLTLEKHRQQARMEARERNEKLARAKYQQFLENQERVLLPPGGVVGQPVIPQDVDRKVPQVDDPFVRPQRSDSVPSAVPSAAGEAAPQQPPGPAAPPATGAPPPSQPSTNDPFARPAVPGNDPFARPQNTTTDPFAPSKPAAPPASPAGSPAPKKSGGLSALLRTVRKAAEKAVPKELPVPGVPGLPGIGGGGNDGDPFGPAPQRGPGGDPFGAPANPAPRGNPPPRNDDPFAPRM